MGCLIIKILLYYEFGVCGGLPCGLCDVATNWESNLKDGDFTNIAADFF